MIPWPQTKGPGFITEGDLTVFAYSECPHSTWPHPTSSFCPTSGQGHLVLQEWSRNEPRVLWLTQSRRGNSLSRFRIVTVYVDSAVPLPFLCAPAPGGRTSPCPAASTCASSLADCPPAVRTHLACVHRKPKSLRIYVFSVQSLTYAWLGDRTHTPAPWTWTWLDSSEEWPMYCFQNFPCGTLIPYTCLTYLPSWSHLPGGFFSSSC